MGEFTHREVSNCMSRLRAGVLLDYNEMADLLVSYGDLLAKRDALAADAALAASLRQILADRGWPMQWDLPLDQMVERAFLDYHNTINSLATDLDAEVAAFAKIKAGLPRWTNYRDNDWHLALSNRAFLGSVQPGEGRWRSAPAGTNVRMYDTREAAMLAVTEALGLPPCEVEGE